MTAVLSWELEEPILLQAYFSWTFLLFVPLIQCKRLCCCNMCSNIVHYYINSVNTNSDGSSNYSINNTSEMLAVFYDIQEDSLNRDFLVPFWRKKCLFLPFWMVKWVECFEYEFWGFQESNSKQWKRLPLLIEHYIWRDMSCAMVSAVYFLGIVFIINLK